MPASVEQRDIAATKRLAKSRPSIKYREQNNIFNNFSQFYLEKSAKRSIFAHRIREIESKWWM